MVAVVTANGTAAAGSTASPSKVMSLGPSLATWMEFYSGRAADDCWRRGRGRGHHVTARLTGGYRQRIVSSFSNPVAATHRAWPERR